MESVQDYYSIGDIAVCGIEIEENGMYLGRIDKYLEFLNYYKNEFIEISECDFKDELIKKLNCEIEFMEVLVNQAREDGVLPKTNNKV